MPVSKDSNNSSSRADILGKGKGKDTGREKRWLAMKDKKVMQKQKKVMKVWKCSEVKKGKKSNKVTKDKKSKNPMFDPPLPLADSQCAECDGTGWANGWVCHFSEECIEAGSDLDRIFRMKAT